MLSVHRLKILNAKLVFFILGLAFQPSNARPIAGSDLYYPYLNQRFHEGRLYYRRNVSLGSCS